MLTPEAMVSPAQVRITLQPFRFSVQTFERQPAELLREHVVALPRPRDYDDPKLSESEAAIVRHVMGPWLIGAGLTPRRRS